MFRVGDQVDAECDGEYELYKDRIYPMTVLNVLKHPLRYTLSFDAYDPDDLNSTDTFMANTVHKRRKVQPNVIYNIGDNVHVQVYRSLDEGSPSWLKGVIVGYGQRNDDIYKVSCKKWDSQMQVFQRKFKYFSEKQLREA